MEGSVEGVDQPGIDDASHADARRAVDPRQPADDDCRGPALDRSPDRGGRIAVRVRQAAAEPLAEAAGDADRPARGPRLTAHPTSAIDCAMHFGDMRSPREGS
jgi:hypothetical protein